MQTYSPVIAKRVRHIYQAHCSGTPEQVFPLLCPVVEYEWLEHWRCEVVYTQSGVAEMDCIFKTRFDSGETEVWTVTQYEKNRLIQFVIVSQSRVTRFTITLNPNGDGTTRADWEQLITALTPAGETYIGTLTEVSFAERHEEITRRMNYYLQHGEMLRD